MREILIATSKEFQNNKMFDLDNTKINRDNCMEPNYKLKIEFAKHGYDFKTIDLGNIGSAEFIIFYDVGHLKHYFEHCIAKKLQSKMILILWEPPVVCPDNYANNIHAHFKKIFTWNDDLVDKKKYFKLFLPQPTYSKSIHSLSFKNKKLITSISSNKTSKHPKELYSQRLAAIKYFSKRFPKDFDFYGMGWESDFSILDKIKMFFFPDFYRSHKGIVEDKVQTFSKYKFSICYENMKEIKGYITEKIFDSFKAGCIPVYWGAENVQEYIPENCFIDKRKFSSYDELAQYLVDMSEVKYQEYKTNIRNFLSSDKYKLFTSESYAKNIIEEVLNK